MAKTKKVTVSMIEETEKIAQEDSVDILGFKNVSGYISYLIKDERVGHREACITVLG
jgi:hypothetical protein